MSQLLHIGTRCSGCGSSPIRGCLWRCGSCPGPEPHHFCTACLVDVNSRHVVSAIALVATLEEGCTEKDAGLTVGNTCTRGVDSACAKASAPPTACTDCGREFAHGAAWMRVDSTPGAANVLCDDCVSADPSQAMVDGQPHVWLRACHTHLTASLNPHRAGLALDTVGCVCGVCGEESAGVRWACLTCEDFDVCWACASTGTFGDHPSDHVLVVRRRPVVSNPSCLGGLETLEDHLGAEIAGPDLRMSGAAGDQRGKGVVQEDKSERASSVVSSPYPDGTATITPEEVLSLVQSRLFPKLAAVAASEGGPGLVRAVLTHANLEARLHLSIADVDISTWTSAGDTLLQATASGPSDDVDRDVDEDEADEEDQDRLQAAINDTLAVRHPQLRAAIDIAFGCLAELKEVPSSTTPQGRDAFWPNVGPEIHHCERAPSGPSERSSDASFLMTLNHTIIDGCIVYLIPFVKLNEVVELGLAAPEHHECCCLSREKPLPSNVIKVFLSHRWLEVGHPDKTGEDWQLAQSTVTMLVAAVVHACGIVLDVLSITPTQLHCSIAVRPPVDERDTIFGIGEYNLPGHGFTDRAGPLVDGALVRDLVLTALSVWHKDAAKVRDALLRRIFVWYDFTCLPQTTRNEAEAELVRSTLRHLSAIQRSMHTLIVNTAADYLPRAWCAAELLNCAYIGSYTTDPMENSIGDSDEDNFDLDNFDNMDELDGVDRLDDNSFGNSESFKLATHAGRVMLNPLIQRPEDVLTTLGLAITYMGDDAEAVCRTLWARVCWQVLSPLSAGLIDFDPAPPGISVDFAPRSWVDVPKRRAKAALIAVGSCARSACRWLDALTRLPNDFSFDEWLALRVDSQLEVNSARDNSPSDILRLCFVPEEGQTQEDDDEIMARHIRNLLQFVSVYGDRLMRVMQACSLAVYYCLDVQSIDLWSKQCLVFGYAQTSDPFLRQVASVLLPGRVRTPRNRQPGRRLVARSRVPRAVDLSAAEQDKDSLLSRKCQPLGEISIDCRLLEVD